MSLPLATPVPAPGLANTPFRSLSTRPCHGEAQGVVKDRHLCVQLLTGTELKQVEFIISAGDSGPALAVPTAISFWSPSRKLSLRKFIACSRQSGLAEDCSEPVAQLLSQAACWLLVVAKWPRVTSEVQNLLSAFSMMHRLPQTVCLVQAAGWLAVVAAFQRLS